MNISYRIDEAVLDVGLVLMFVGILLTVLIWVEKDDD